MTTQKPTFSFAPQTNAAASTSLFCAPQTNASASTFMCGAPQTNATAAAHSSQTSAGAPPEFSFGPAPKRARKMPDKSMFIPRAFREMDNNKLRVSYPFYSLEASVLRHNGVDKPIYLNEKFLRSCFPNWKQTYKYYPGTLEGWDWIMKKLSGINTFWWNDLSSIVLILTHLGCSIESICMLMWDEIQDRLALKDGSEFKDDCWDEIDSTIIKRFVEIVSSYVDDGPFPHSIGPSVNPYLSFVSKHIVQSSDSDSDIDDICDI